MVSIAFLLTHPFEKKRAYIKVTENPPELFQPAIGHIGIIVDVGKRKSLNGLTDEPTGFITTEFFINGEFRCFQGSATAFPDVDRETVPDDLVKLLNKRDREWATLLKQTDKAATIGEKENSRKIAESDAFIIGFFEKSRNFWKAWKGPGAPPIDPDTGLSATERYHPVLEKALHEKALEKIKKPPS